MATVVVLLSACGSSARVSTGPRPTVALVDLPRVAHPLDWEAIDFGRLRLWLPPGWQVNTNGCNVTSYANQVTLEPPANECVPDSGTEVTVRLASTRGASAGWRRSTINGVAVWSHRTRDTTVFAAPSLGVRIVAAGSTGMAVALTLGPSPLAALSRLTGPVTVPASWKAIRFDGFSVDVPQKWAVSRVSADCGTLFFGDATVYEDQPQYVASCDIVLPVYLLRPGDGLWLEEVTSRQSLPSGHHVILRNVTVGVSPARSVLGGQGGVPIANLTVNAGDHTLEAQLGLGANPAIAEEVLSSLSYLGTSSPNTPVDVPPLPTATTSVLGHNHPLSTTSVTTH